MDLSPEYLPERVRSLTEQLIDGLGLPEDLRSFLAERISFSSFKTIADDDETIIADICDELPTLAACILMRDTFLHLVHKATDDIELREQVVFVLPMLTHLKEFMFGMAKIYCLHTPDSYPGAFRVTANGRRLVLSGNRYGKVGVLQALQLETQSHIKSEPQIPYNVFEKVVKTIIGTKLDVPADVGMKVFRVDPSGKVVEEIGDDLPEDPSLLDQFTIKKPFIKH